MVWSHNYDIAFYLNHFDEMIVLHYVVIDDSNTVKRFSNFMAHVSTYRDSRKRD